MKSFSFLCAAALALCLGAVSEAAADEFTPVFKVGAGFGSKIAGDATLGLDYNFGGLVLGAGLSEEVFGGSGLHRLDSVIAKVGYKASGLIGDRDLTLSAVGGVGNGQSYGNHLTETVGVEVDLTRDKDSAGGAVRYEHVMPGGYSPREDLVLFELTFKPF